MATRPAPAPCLHPDAPRESPGGGVPSIAALDRVKAILRNPALHELSAAIPQRRDATGRPRAYPAFMNLVFDALISVYGSARQVEAELNNRVVWKSMRRTLKKAFPHDSTMRLPPRPMRRHHYLYFRNRYLTTPDALERLSTAHRKSAAAQARQIGLLDPEGPGSWTHPDLTRLLYADGKVVTPLFDGRLGDLRTDPRTGVGRQVRYEPDAGVHFEGGGSVAFGTKFVLVATRSTEPRERIILDVQWVPNGQPEATAAMACFSRLRTLVPGAQGVIYDSALRGIHRQALLREHGLLPINRPRGSAGQPGRRTVLVETHPAQNRDGSVHLLRLVARDGAVGIQDEVGAFAELCRVRTMRCRDQSGLYRWYSELELPPNYCQKTILVRLDTRAPDAVRGFNRPEHVLAIPPSDPDFKRLYGRRSDAESINRGLEDTLYWNRAHSLGHARQLLNLLGYALMVNSLAIRQHRRRQSLPPAA